MSCPGTILVVLFLLRHIPGSQRISTGKQKTKKQTSSSYQAAAINNTAKAGRKVIYLE
jgi:hypothetical protein